jgi:uncharacterized membrane protein YjgN (DUF898 family)
MSNPGNRSHFDGSVVEYWFIIIGTLVMGVMTFGLAIPWTLCYKEKYIAHHTIIEGQRLKFTGSGMDLFVEFIKLWVFTILTMGIYGFWAWIHIQRWKVENTQFGQSVSA